MPRKISDFTRPMARLNAALPALVLILPSLVWVCLDRSVWSWDQSAYGEVSVELHYRLLHDPAHWPRAMLTALPTKAPGITWFGQWFVPLGRAFGSVDAALHLSVVLPQLITLVLVFKIGRELSGAGNWFVTLAGCVFVGSAPLFVAMSHQYLVEAAQTTAVAWVYWIALRGMHWSRLQLLSRVCAAGAAAMLMKQTSPLYCLLPGVMAVVELFLPRGGRGNEPRRALARHLGGLAAATGLLLLTAAWYWQNVEHVFRHSYQSAVGEVSLHYGSKAPLLTKAQFWLSAAANGLATPVLFAFASLVTAAALVSFGIRLRREKKFGVLQAGDWVALCALLHILATISAFIVSVNEDTRYLLPCLPAGAVLVMWALTRIPGRAVAIGFLAVAAAQWLVVHAIAFGLFENSYDQWLTKLNRDSGVATELSRVVDLTCAEADLGNRFHTVGIELPWFNFNTLNYYAAKKQLEIHRRSYFRSFGFAETRLERALWSMQAYRTATFLSLEPSRQPRPPDFLNALSLPVLDVVSKSPAFRPVPFLSECGIVIWRRVENSAAPPP